MTKEVYTKIEQFMLSCMKDSAHDREHVYRVLNNALRIAREEEGVDYDVLICACLLHDIGREEQYRDPSLCHARVGAKKAEQFLMENGFGADFAQKVARCILTHRYRSGNEPQSVEEKILFDADKLDAAGAMGIARTLMYKGIVSEPLYTLNADGTVCDGSGGGGDELRTTSFFREYKWKLEKIYDRFYTKKGAELAALRKKAAADFYESLLGEVRFSCEPIDAVWESKSRENKSRNNGKEGSRP